MADAYDSTKDIQMHQGKVQRIMTLLAQRLMLRANLHDASKLKQPEKHLFDKWTPELQKVEFGSEEYKAALEAMGSALRHHYRHNPHHIEHFDNGIDGMTLLDLCEMVADWIAAAQAKGKPVSMAYLKERFHLSDQLANIISNTVSKMTW